jgi:hypothetical protein
MTARDFCYWLQGHLEIDMADDEITGVSGSTVLSEKQVECIRKHLALVFVHDIDPKAGGPEKQAQLNDIHSRPPLARC